MTTEPIRTQGASAANDPVPGTLDYLRVVVSRAKRVNGRRRSWRYRAGLTRVWVTTSGKNGWELVTRWSLIRAAFSRKDVWL